MIGRCYLNERSGWKNNLGNRYLRQGKAFGCLEEDRHDLDDCMISMIFLPFGFYFYFYRKFFWRQVHDGLRRCGYFLHKIS